MRVEPKTSDKLWVPTIRVETSRERDASSLRHPRLPIRVGSRSAVAIHRRRARVRLARGRSCVFRDGSIACRACVRRVACTVDDRRNAWRINGDPIAVCFGLLRWCRNDRLPTRAPVVASVDRVHVVRCVRCAARETNHAARCRKIDRSCVARRQRRDARDHVARRHRSRIREPRGCDVKRSDMPCRLRAWAMGDANALRFGAAGWTIAVMLGVWLVVERRARREAERAREARDRESDAERAERMRRQREALDVMRSALVALDRETRDDERR